VYLVTCECGSKYYLKEDNHYSYTFECYDCRFPIIHNYSEETGHEVNVQLEVLHHYKYLKYYEFKSYDEGIDMRHEIKFLKVKLKSLAEEARIIRKEELRTFDNELREKLYLHRTWTVRIEARATLLAYCFLRGKSYLDVEQSSHSIPNWDKVEAMIKKYATSELPRLTEWKKVDKTSIAA